MDDLWIDFLWGVFFLNIGVLLGSSFYLVTRHRSFWVHVKLVLFMLGSKGPEGKPFNIRRFLSGPKRYVDLLREYLAGDVRLVRINGRAVRCSGRVLIWLWWTDPVSGTTYWWRERYREYRGVKVSRARYGQTCSETLRPGGETILDAALRGVWEEARLRVEREQLDCSTFAHLCRMVTAESTVFWGFLSQTFLYAVLLNLSLLDPQQMEEFFARGESFDIDDNGVTIHIEREEGPPPTVRGRHPLLPSLIEMKHIEDGVHADEDKELQ